MTDVDWHLAQLNVGRLVAPEGDPRVAGFFAALDELNALADAAPGFVWRLVDDDGGDATGLRPFGDETLVNMSVWESVESLYAFTYRSAHLDVLRRRREWFHALGEAYAVLWWVPAGHRPTVQEAGARLDLLKAEGPTAGAFTFRALFPWDSALPPVEHPERPESVPSARPTHPILEREMDAAGVNPIE